MANEKLPSKPDLPVKIIQFGGGVFMRGFIDWMINRMNYQNLFDGSVVLVKLTPGGSFQNYDDQQGQYHHLIRGLSRGDLVETTELITCIKDWIHPYENWRGFLDAAANPDLRFVFSNATEAGIAYSEIDFPQTCPLSFPAKLAAFLYERYRFFKGNFKKGLIIIPCELIEENGQTLKNIILQHAQDWQLEEDFAAWLENANIFADTLVDRIVAPPSETEKPEILKQLSFEDNLLDGSEPYHLFAIQAPEKIQNELPLEQAGVNVIWTDDVRPYRERKVKILNGGNTLMTIPAFLKGIDTVKEAIGDPVVFEFLKKGIYREIIPTMDLDNEELTNYADTILERFQNPYVNHLLYNISLNSISKFNVRLVPSLIGYHDKTGNIPEAICFSLAALLFFYRSEKGAADQYIGRRNKETFVVRDEKGVLEILFQYWQNYDKNDGKNFVETVLADSRLWGQDLNSIPELTKTVCNHLLLIDEIGMEAALKQFVGN